VLRGWLAGIHFLGRDWFDPTNPIRARRAKGFNSPHVHRRKKRKKSYDLRYKILAPTPCNEQGCSNKAIARGVCQEHKKPAFFGHNRKSRLPPDWRTRRLIVLKRDGGICYLCGEPGADTVDHVIPNDDNGLHNLKAVHDSAPPHCHRYKTSKEGTNAILGWRAKRRY
jgi:hypothetical protein